VGEITALAASQALDLATAIKLVSARAAAMAQAVPRGTAGMADVLGLDDTTVAQLCRDNAQTEVLEPVNFNAPGQVVVAGHLGAIDRLKVAARQAGAKMVFVLPVSGPFHSALMTSAAQALVSTLAPLTFAEPRFGVLHNCDLRLASQASIKPALVLHLIRPVNWVGTIRAMADAGITHIVELGPGEVLSNLCKRITPQMVVRAANTPDNLALARESLMHEPLAS
jgi:[acyl-carrier-protein] S-malonyltransferase